MLGIMRRLGPYILSIFVAELLLRLIGYAPQGRPTPVGLHVLFERDAKMGWRLKPTGAGTSEWGKRSVTVWPDSSRATSSQVQTLALASEHTRLKNVIFLGDSVTMGTGLSDQQTLAFKLQQRFPELLVFNYATPGYSGCQALIWLEELIKKELAPSLFIYGLCDFHEVRNIGHPRFLWQLAQVATTKSAYMPYCLLNDSGQITKYPADIFEDPIPLLTNNLSLATLFTEVYYEIKARPRVASMHAVTLQIMREMNAKAKQHGHQLLILIESAASSNREQYRTFLTQEDFNFIDGIPNQNQTESMYLPNDGHPSEHLTEFWAEEIAQYLKSKLRVQTVSK